MKGLAHLVLSLVLTSGVAYAHGTNDHVRGVVTSITATSITVQTGAAATATRTLTLTPKTTFQLGSKRAGVADVKVGQRVVIDVPAKTSNALVIQIGAMVAAPQAAAPKAGAAAAVATLVGDISDSMCGATHHEGMAAASCTEMCLKQGAALVFVSKGKVYKLTDTNKLAAAHAGRTVTLTGEVQGDTIKVAKIQARAAAKS